MPSTGSERRSPVQRQVNDIARKINRGLAALYGARLIAVFVFGSYARGEADEESDMDVLIVLDRVESYGAEVDRTSEIIGELSLRYGVSISRVFVSEDEWLHGDTVFLQNVREEAIAV
ncbi:MAG: nucleotidyltransferase domain-containing protein [Planctomycetota bacterium]